jgi:hypothetical protein
VPPQWTVGTQRLHLVTCQSISIDQTPKSTSLFTSQNGIPRRENNTCCWNLWWKHFLGHNTRACQTKFKGLENYRYCFVFV